MLSVPSVYEMVLIHVEDSQRENRAILFATSIQCKKIRGRLGRTPVRVILSVDVRIWDLGAGTPSSGHALIGSGPVCGEG